MKSHEQNKQDPKKEDNIFTRDHSHDFSSGPMTSAPEETEEEKKAAEEEKKEIEKELGEEG